jgi:hypothetical protein
MYYIVTARLIPDTAAELLRKLTDGTISSQKPDGKEIVASMERAKLADDGLVRWSEVCYCATPLAHERQTVYDHYVTEMETEEVEGYVEFEGEPLMDYLNGLAE